MTCLENWWGSCFTCPTGFLSPPVGSFKTLSWQVKISIWNITIVDNVKFLKHWCLTLQPSFNGSVMMYKFFDSSWVPSFLKKSLISVAKFDYLGYLDDLDFKWRCFLCPSWLGLIITSMYSLPRDELWLVQVSIGWTITEDILLTLFQDLNF